jgi:hypothetical protein
VSTAKKLTAQNAVVSTATVEIKTLTLSGKQITLSVFRQIQEDALVQLLSDRAVLCGEPWGWVTYFWPGCLPRDGCSGELVKGTSDPLHVVWQLGSELRRSIVLGMAHIEEVTNDRIWRSKHLGCPVSDVQESNADLWQSYADLLDRLRDLPQLFIAI